MDTRRTLKEDRIPYYFGHLLNKYKNNSFDAIIVNDNDALNLMLENRKGSPFEKVPLLFTGISNIEDYDFEAEDLYGINEKPGHKVVLESIQKVFPQRNKIFVIVDRSASGQVYAKNFEEYREEYKNLFFFVIDSLDFSNWKLILNQLNTSESIIYYTGVTQDRFGNKISSDLLLSSIVDLNIPVYSGFITDVPGVLGGEHNSGVYHGIGCAKMTLDLLNNKPPKQRITTPELVMIYDKQVMDKFDVKNRDLPNSVKIISKNESLFRKYRLIIIANLLLILLLSAIIALLLRNNIIQKKYRASLHLARDNAMKSDLLKSAFLANVSHEFRTPLNAIVGFSDLLMEENKDPDLELYIQLINTNADLLTQLINDVLDLSLIDSNQLKFNIQSIDTQAVFNSMKQQIAQYLVDIRKEDITLELNVSDRVDVIFKSDELRFRQIVLNLLQNASKFTKTGSIEFGYKFLSGKELRNLFVKDIKIRDNELFLYVYVKDTGIGIPENMLTNIFKRFTRGETNEIKNISGTGLGLSICESVIKNFGGAIEVKSELDVGSVFYFYVPVDPGV